MILEKCRESNYENLFNYALKNIKDSHNSDGISSNISDMFDCFGFSVSPKKSGKVTPFLLAFSISNIEILKELIKCNLVTNMTGLVLSAYTTVKILAELGADLKVFDDFGRDAIHTACYVQDPEIVEYFLNLIF